MDRGYSVTYNIRATRTKSKEDRRYYDEILKALSESEVQKKQIENDTSELETRVEAKKVIIFMSLKADRRYNEFEMYQ